jgi:hypothetical protein
MHSTEHSGEALGKDSISPVSTSQVIDFVAGFSRILAIFPAEPDRSRLARPRHALLTHRFIHTAKSSVKECWKKNHLARNAELGVTSQNTTIHYFDDLGPRRGHSGR